MATSLAQRFQHVRLVHLHWELRASDGRVLRCGVYDTPDGPVLLAGYDEGWLWQAALAPGERGSQNADRWRQAMLGSGAFTG